MLKKERFIDNQDGTMTDSTTELVWMQEDAWQKEAKWFTWDEAAELANHLDLKYTELKKSLGNIGENKLLLITAIKVVDDYFDLFKKVKSTKDDFQELSNKFKELKTLAINYKDEKELEIEKFNPQEYWTINALFSNNNNEQKYYKKRS